MNDSTHSRTRILTADEIDEFLRGSIVGHLGCHADGETYVIPITYAFDGDRIVGQTNEGRKVDMMRKNPKVCLQVDRVKSLHEWTCAIIWGEYRELTGIEASKAMGILLDRFQDQEDRYDPSRGGRTVSPPRPDATPGGLVVYQIEISEKSGRAEG